MKTLGAETPINTPTSIRKVLVAVDLTEYSAATGKYAAEIAKCFDAALTIVHVYAPDRLYEFGGEPVVVLLEEQQADYQRQLNSLREELTKTVPRCDSVFLVGEPAEKVSSLARDIGADLIVTGSHHPTFLARLFNLDKAPAIMHRAPCPVLVYHEKSA